MQNGTPATSKEAFSTQPITDSLPIDGENDIKTPFDAQPDQPAKRRGRPPAAEKPAPEKKFRYFPIAPRKVVGTGKEWGQGEFIKYWRKVAADPELRDRAVCYVYRTYPVTNVNPPGENIEDDSKKSKYLDVTSQPFESDEDVWRRYGAGDYKFYLNDVDFPGRGKTQMTCYFQGTREWEQYPPQIDLKTLDMADPKNGAYIRYLQQKGLLPKDGDEDDDMSSRLADTVDSLTTKIVDMASRPATPAAPAPANFSANATSEAVAAVTQGFAAANRVQMEMLSAAVDKATAVQARTQDPFDTLAKIMGTMREMYPKQDNSALEATLRASLERSAGLEDKLAQMQASLAEQRVRDLEAKLAERQAQQQPNAPAKDLFTQAREFAELQRELKGILNGTKETDDDSDESRPSGRGEPWYAKHLPAALGFAGFVIAGLNSYMHNRAVAATHQGQPAPPPAPPPDLLPPAMQQAAAVIANPAEQGAPPMDPRAQQVQLLIKAIETPLSRYLEDNRSGHDFAEWFVDSYGEALFREVQTAGADNIVMAISQYAPALFGKMQQAPTVAHQFVTDFLTGPQEEGEGEK